MNDYYVYIYYRLDTNEPFYIGKGKDDRWKYIWDRNKHFNNIINKYPIAVEIVKDNLTEEQALGIECWLIHELVFEYGYSIDIKNSRSSEKGCHLVNQTWGGEGVSGANLGKKKSKAHKEKMSKNHSKYWKGKPSKEQPNAKSVICLTTKKIFYSMIDGANYYKCGRRHISECCNGNRKSCGKYNGQKLVWRKLNYKHNKIYRISDNSILKRVK